MLRTLTHGAERERRAHGIIAPASIASGTRDVDARAAAARASASCTVPAAGAGRVVRVQRSRATGHECEGRRATQARRVARRGHLALWCAPSWTAVCATGTRGEMDPARSRSDGSTHLGGEMDSARSARRGAETRAQGADSIGAPALGSRGETLRTLVKRPNTPRALCVWPFRP